jgi:O-antigen/teichoic acid export membrane protein
MYTTFANVEFYYDKNKFSMYISSAGALLNLILNYFGIKMYGYIAAAYTTLICYILFAAGHYIYMSQSVKKGEGIGWVFNTKRLALLSLGVVAFGIVIIFFYENIVVRYSIIVGICVIVFILRKRIIPALLVVKKHK